MFVNVVSVNDVSGPPSGVGLASWFGIRINHTWSDVKSPVYLISLWSTDMLYKWVNSLCRCVMASFSILELMVFMPDDLCVFIFCMCFSTWFVVKGLR